MQNPVTYMASWAPRAAARLYPGTVVRASLPENSEPTLFLSFDDGPTPVLTPRILELLEHHGAKATFFVLGTTANQHPALIREMIDLGHIVGNHSHTHVDPWRCKPEVLAADFERAKGVIEDITGSASTLVRPPYGHVTSGLKDWAENRDALLVLWDVMAGDYLWSSSADGVVSIVERLSRPGSIVVLHDNTDPNVERTTYRALAKILNRFTRKGWKFAAIRKTDLPVADHGAAEPAS